MSPGSTKEPIGDPSNDDAEDSDVFYGSFVTTEQAYEYEATHWLELGADVLPNYNGSIIAMVRRYAAGAADVMDFGAGIGTLSAAMRAAGLEPLCLEPDVRQRAELVRRGFKTVAALADIPDHSLDYIYSSNVLEHIEDDVQALTDLRRKLRPGGRLFLYIPAFQSLYSSLDEFVGHFRRYDKVMLNQKLLQSGYGVEQLYYADVLGYFVTRLYKLIGNNTNKINPFTLRLFDRIVFPVGTMIERVVKVPVGKNIVGVARNP